MRGHRHAQRGAALLSFAVLLSVVILTIVLSYTATLARRQTATLEPRQQAYVAQLLDKAQQYYIANASAIDSNARWDEFDSAMVRAAIIGEDRWNVRVVLSNPLTSSDGTLRTRRILVYVPTDVDDTNPPVTASFATTGNFAPCTVVDPLSTACRRAWGIFDGGALQRAHHTRTRQKLENLAAKAQIYFKARVLEDPERNASVNYFRPTNGTANGTGRDLPAVDVYESLALNSDILEKIGLEPSHLVDAWGNNISVSNGQDSSTLSPPFSMSFRARTPYGEVLAIRGVQPL